MPTMSSNGSPKGSRRSCGGGANRRDGKNKKPLKNRIAKGILRANGIQNPRAEDLMIKHMDRITNLCAETYPGENIKNEAGYQWLARLAIVDVAMELGISSTSGGSKPQPAEKKFIKEKMPCPNCLQADKLSQFPCDPPFADIVCERCELVIEIKALQRKHVDLETNQLLIPMDKRAVELPEIAIPQKNIGVCAHVAGLGWWFISRDELVAQIKRAKQDRNVTKVEGSNRKQVPVIGERKKTSRKIIILKRRT